MYPNQFTNPSLISKLLSLKDTIKWSELLEGTKKTLDVVNQAIPIYYQVKPIVTNAKTLFKVANVINSDTNTNNKTEVIDKNEEEAQSEIKEEVSTTSSKNNSPIFYL